MRIDGTDASTMNYGSKSGQGVDINTQVKAPSEEKGEISNDPKLSHLSEYEKRELPVGEKVVLEAVERANKAISMSGRTFEYRIHDKTKEIMIKVINSDTKEVIREIPPEKVLDMVAKMMEMAGIMVDERR